ncbi:MAG: tetratricopeptide repeat protein [Myxococcales bacterium]|nr:tetratricopeptide repeat protein [Myxococcales bacterium]
MRNSGWLAPLVLVLAGIAPYASQLDAPFVLDDGRAIVRNPNVRALWPLSDAISAPSGSPTAGRPTTSLTLAISFALGGLSPAAFRAGNLALHVLSALALYGVLRRTLLAKRLGRRFARDANALAFTTALLWVLHPLCTEIVLYVTQRSDSLMSLFLLLTLYATLRNDAAATRATRNTWLSVSAIACALGMGSKEVMVVAPLLVLLHDQVFFSGSLAAAVRRRPGLYAALAASWGVLATAMLTGPDYHAMRMGYSLDVGPFDYLLSQGIVILGYLQHAFWPYPLLLDYGDYAPVTLVDAALPAAVVAALCIAAFALYGLGWWRNNVGQMALGFVGLWFFVILSPTSSIVPIPSEVGAERRMYLPLVAPLLAFVLLARRLLRASPAPLLVGVVALVALLLGTGSFARARDYRSSLALWTTVVERNPGNARGWLARGDALRDTGRIDEAIEHYHTALRLDPDYVEAHNNLGVALLASGEAAGAITAFGAAASNAPRALFFHSNLAQAQVAGGRFANAVTNYLRELELQPRFTPPMREAAWILATHPDAQLRDASEAVRIASRAAQLAPNDPQVLDALAAALASASRFEEARTAALRALERAAASSHPGAKAIRARLQLYEAERPYRSDVDDWSGPGR